MVSGITAPGAHFDWGPVVGGYLGLVLMASSFLAMGLVASAVSRNQIVGFIVGLLVCFAFYFVDKFAILLPESLAQVVEYISVDYHFENVARGVVDDPTWFGLVFAADPEDDWRLEATWRKANPNYGISVKPDDLARKATKAQHVPADEPEFRRLHLGQWVQQAEKYISLLSWDQEANAAPIDRESLRGKPCVLGLDVSSKFDFTAIVAVFSRPGGGVIALPHIIAPASAAEKRSLVPIEAWRRGGFLQITDGNVIDAEAIKAVVLALSKEFLVQEIAFDSWNAIQLATELQAHGLELVEVRQGFKTLSEPTKELAALIARGECQHGGHPVLRWMADNLVVREDPNGNLAPDKAKAAEKIDGIVALIMALSRRGKLKTRAAGPRERGILVL